MKGSIKGRIKWSVLERKQLGTGSREENQLEDSKIRYQERPERGKGQEFLLFS